VEPDIKLTLFLGVITALTQPNPSALRAAIKETRTMTSKPFGVNITLLPSINPPDYAGYARAAVEEGVTIFETAGNSRAFDRPSRVLAQD
jgi:subtilisin family serine protease